MKSAYVWLASWFLLAGCAAGAASSGASKSASAQASVGPLIELVPPGPQQILLARPKELAAQRAALLLWRAIVPEDRERAFAERTGVEPRAVEELVAFELPKGGYVVMARGPFDAAEVVRSAGTRLAITDVSVDAPVMRREGLRGDGRYAYAALDAHAVLAAKEITPALLGQILARRVDHAAPRVLDPPDAQALHADHRAAPLLVFAPRPLALPTDTGVGLLLARERALSVAVVPNNDDLAVTVDLRGEFPPGAEHNFRTLARSIGATPLGAAFGLAQIAEHMGARVDAQGVMLSFRVAAADLVAGTRMVFFEDMRELMDFDAVPEKGTPKR